MVGHIDKPPVKGIQARRPATTGSEWVTRTALNADHPPGLFRNRSGGSAATEVDIDAGHHDLRGLRIGLDRASACMSMPVKGRMHLLRLATAGLVLLVGCGEVLGQVQKRTAAVSEEQLLLEPLKIPELLTTKRISVEDVPDPHWRREACSACHRGTPSRSDLKLIDNDINALCNTCHSAVSEHDYIHPVGMVPPERMVERMRPKFRAAIERGGGKVTCIACHDVPAQCLAERERERALNPLFFWNAPHRTRSDLCYFCHDPSYYDRLNAHEQIADNGKVMEARCLICHETTTQLQAATGIATLDFVVDADLSQMCTVCHPWIPHPASVSLSGKEPPDHLVAPSPEVAQHMQRTQTKSDIELPLDPTTGRIFCGTCHDPHERGALRTLRRSDEEVEHRLRAKEICIMCHDM